MKQRYVSSASYGLELLRALQHADLPPRKLSHLLTLASRRNHLVDWSIYPQSLKESCEAQEKYLSKLARQEINGRSYSPDLVKLWLTGRCIPTVRTQLVIRGSLGADTALAETSDQAARRFLIESGRDANDILKAAGENLNAKQRSQVAFWQRRKDGPALPGRLTSVILKFFDVRQPPYADSEMMLEYHSLMRQGDYFSLRLLVQNRRQISELEEQVVTLSEQLSATERELQATSHRLDVSEKGYTELLEEALELLTQVEGANEGRNEVSENFRRTWLEGVAVLVGTDTYDNFPPTPMVKNNLDGLENAITQQLGIPSDRVYKIYNPSSEPDVLEIINEARKRPSPEHGGLILYYSGHGWTNSTGQLHLGLTRSDKEKPWTALRYNFVRDLLVDASVASRVVILDACYSGAALPFLSEDDVGSDVAIEGSYVLASSDRTERSLAEGREGYTPFTAEILKTLVMGISKGPSVITMADLFNNVKQRCLAHGWPVPVRQDLCDGGKIGLVPNRGSKF